MYINTTIMEYDMENAGISILMDLKLITKSEYIKAIQMSKQNRVIYTGLLQKNNPVLSKKLTESYELYTNNFININHLNDFVLEKNKDAVWIIGRIPKTVRLSKYILFIQKSKYSSYIKLKKNIHLYYDQMSNKLISRGAKLNTESILYKDKLIHDIIKRKEKNIDIYERLHTIKNNLIKDKNYYGDNLISGIDNMKLINLLLKYLL